MGTKTQSGFTFIEVMLFLAVTGLLAMGILVGSGTAISQQRYRDSVSSLKSYLQQQYSEVTNVINSRDEQWECNSSGAVTDTGGPAGEARGRSECVLLGRFVTIDNDGKKLTTSSVSAYRAPGAVVATSDIDEIKDNYRLSISPIDQDITNVSWGAQIIKAGEPTLTPMPLSILIVRSPLSGSILTFSVPGVQTNLNGMVETTNMGTVRNLCVNPDGGILVGKRLEVRLAPFAANQGGVSVPPESESVCG